MANEHERRQGITYEIRLKGNLGPEWSAWFDGFTITPKEGGETLLVGQVSDQPALHGLLSKVRDLGLTLIRVEQIGKVSRKEE
jgi:hypothetical protein